MYLRKITATPTGYKLTIPKVLAEEVLNIMETDREVILKTEKGKIIITKKGDVK